jgi:hypothetical protein
VCWPQAPGPAGSAHGSLAIRAGSLPDRSFVAPASYRDGEGARNAPRGSRGGRIMKGFVSRANLVSKLWFAAEFLDEGGTSNFIQSGSLTGLKRLLRSSLPLGAEPGAATRSVQYLRRLRTHIARNPHTNHPVHSHTHAQHDTESLRVVNKIRCLLTMPTFRV